VVKTLIDQWNSPTINEEEFVQLGSDDKRRYHEEDLTRGFTPREAAARANMFRASFPDVKISYEDLEVRGNIVTVIGMKTRGTHTGAPFSAVEPYPVIEASGIYCENDEEELSVELDDQCKIKRCRVISLGSKSGLAGFYEQIGGQIGGSTTIPAKAA
jgi:hypothetical protein